MTKPGLSLLAVLLDRSSSVRPTADAIRSGVDALLAEQGGRPGELLVTVTGCNATGHGPVHGSRPVADVGPVALRARGESALHDGIVTLIDDVGAELAGLDESERPERVIVLVVGDTGADGDGERVRAAVQHQRSAYAWEFVVVDVSGRDHVPAAGDRQVGVDEPGRDAPADDEGAPEVRDVATSVAMAQARLGVPATAAILAGPGSDGVLAGLGAASAFVSRARESRPWEPVEGFTDDERAAASTPTRPQWWRRLLGAAG